MLRKNVNAFHEAIRLWSSASDEPEGSTEGYDRIVDQAGIEYTWGVVLDRPKPAVGIRRSHPDGVNAIPCAALDEGEQRLGGARSTTEQARAADPAHPRRQPRQTLTRRVASMTHA